MLYFFFLVLSILTIVAQAAFLLMMVGYPQSPATLTGPREDSSATVGIVGKSLLSWIRERQMGRFVRVCVGALFVVSLVSTSILVAVGP